MFKKTLVSPIAVAFGLALTGAAASQTFVGTQEISDADLPEVQEHCDALLAEEGLALSGEVDLDSDVGTAVGGGLTDTDTDADTEINAEGGVGADAGVGTDLDVGTDAGVDAGVDAGIDTDTDIGMDAGVDADTDAGVGTDTEFDTGLDLDAITLEDCRLAGLIE